MAKKTSKVLYDLTRTVGKAASTMNDLENLGKSIQTGDPSHIAKRLARKTATKNANKVSSNINKLFK
ncbi:hypothetical protein [Alkaliphilus sp. B6464]|uniref:hypothetical protein n=1 Tax=Alkaliphilus sp. B6464 TaxID=2731219 RepID=UPI001BAB63C2|nr:hypothetical protein [Alkaliphilus sp. B6464]QUH21872.1 hypothetical protein HYG84_18215 [Alkaliphilus sp. B6464]